MDVTLVRSQTVMTLVSAISGGRRHHCALFERLDEDGDRRTLSMEYDTWEEMGRPNTVTVTIEPGDRLNQED